MREQTQGIRQFPDFPEPGIGRDERAVPGAGGFLSLQYRIRILSPDEAMRDKPKKYALYGLRFPFFLIESIFGRLYVFTGIKNVD